MEGVTFLDPRIQKAFENFVEIRLHTDGGGAYTQTSAKNRALLQSRFQSVTIPYYAVLDPTGKHVYWQGGGVIGAAAFLKHLQSYREP